MVVFGDTSVIFASDTADKVFLYLPHDFYLCFRAYTYDGNDNLLTRVTPKAETIRFEYNAVNELITKTLPGNLLTQYGYDAVGNLISVTDPDSTLTMTYDQANRLLTTSTAGSSTQPSVTLTHTYDKNGNRLTAVDSSGTNTYTYDSLNRLASLASLVTVCLRTKRGHSTVLRGARALPD